MVTALRCRACGGVSAPRRAHLTGYYRCEQCGAANVAEVAAAEAWDAPESEAVLVRRGSRVQVVLPSGLLLDGRMLVVAIFMIIVLGFGAAGVWQLAQPSSPLRSWAPVLAALLMAPALRALWRRHRAQQCLDLSPTRLQVSRLRGAARTHRLEHAFRLGELRVETVQRSDALGRQRHAVELHGTWSRSVRILCAGERAAAWLAAVVREASIRASSEPCGGCGAPLPAGVQERVSGELVCQFCRTRYVVDGQSVELAALVLPAACEAGAASGAVAEEHRHGGVAWRIGSSRLVARAFFATQLAAAAAFFTLAAVGVGVWLVPLAAHDGVSGFAVSLACGALLFGYVGFFAGLAAANILLGASRLRLDESTAEHELLLAGFAVPKWLQLGGWTSYKRLLHLDHREQQAVSIFTGYVAPLRQRVALARLTEVQFFEGYGSTELQLVTPSRTMRLRWDLAHPEDVHLRRRIIEEVSRRLRDLGREFTTAPAPRSGLAGRSAAT